MSGIGITFVVVVYQNCDQKHEKSGSGCQFGITIVIGIYRLVEEGVCHALGGAIACGGRLYTKYRLEEGVIMCYSEGIS